ncbi:hypothetical protein LSAT2_027406 [Lamellibrachia satsuma]|nr:hypothetical protein LSAT2_027406 [Lamellibrachia satsuma]
MWEGDVGLAPTTRDKTDVGGVCRACTNDKRQDWSRGDRTVRRRLRHYTRRQGEQNHKYATPSNRKPEIARDTTYPLIRNHVKSRAY